MRLLLLEDRVVRQKNFVQELGDDMFKKYSDVLDNKIGPDFEKFKIEFENKNFSSLNDYQGIIIHRSAFNKEVKVGIFDHCKALKKPLVYFSGGISSVSFEESIGFQFLTINSKDFYSQYLVDFLQGVRGTSEINLGQLGFGNNWELNLLLSLRQKISFDWIFDGKSTKCDVSEIQSKYQIQNDYLINLLQSKLSWFVEGEVVDNPDERISEIKNAIQEEISNKIVFE